MRMVEFRLRAGGADAVEDAEEKEARNTFYTLMAYHSVENEMAVYRALGHRANEGR